jgi:hypothetical protein
MGYHADLVSLCLRPPVAPRCLPALQVALSYLLKPKDCPEGLQISERWGGGICL